MLNRLHRDTGRWIWNRAEEAPGIQSSIAEELVDRTVILVTTRFHGVVLNSLALINGRVAARLHVELIHCIDRNRSPYIAGVAIAAGANKRKTVDIHVRDRATAAGAVHNTGVRRRVAVGVVALHAGHQEGEVCRTALVNARDCRTRPSGSAARSTYRSPSSRRAWRCSTPPIAAAQSKHRCSGSKVRTHRQGKLKIGDFQRIDVDTLLIQRLKTLRCHSHFIDVVIQRSQVKFTGISCGSRKHRPRRR